MAHQVRNTILKVIKSAGIPENRAKVYYDWTLPAITSNISQNNLGGAQAIFRIVYNSLKSADDHFIKDPTTGLPDAARLSSESMAGISLCGDPLPAPNTDSGIFNGSDSVLILNSKSMTNWTIFLDMSSVCPMYKNKLRIIASNKKKPSDKNGVIIGLNGANNLFCEYTDTSTGKRNVRYLNKSLGENAVICVSKSDDMNTLLLGAFDPVLKETFSKTFEVYGKKSGKEWILGGTYDPVTNDTKYDMFTGTMKHFVLINGSANVGQIDKICQSFFVASFEEERYEMVPTEVPNAGENVETTVEGELKISGHTYEQKIVTLRCELDTSTGLPKTVTYENKVPKYERDLETVTQYIEGEGTHTVDVKTFFPESVVYNDSTVKDYAGRCLALDSSLYVAGSTEIYSEDTVRNEIGKAAKLVAPITPTGPYTFELDKSYSNQININIYLDGKLKENGKDYTISDGKTVSSLQESYSNNSKMVYDVIEGNDPVFYDFTWYTGNLWWGGQSGKDVYFNGIKLIYTQDYYDYSDGAGGEWLILDASSLYAVSPTGGRLAFITRDTQNTSYGSNKYTYCQTFHILSERVWLDGIRLTKGIDYSITCMCDLNNSNSVAEQKTTLFYNNEGTFFNI